MVIPPMDMADFPNIGWKDHLQEGLKFTAGNRGFPVHSPLHRLNDKQLLPC